VDEPLDVGVVILVERLVGALEEYLAVAEHDDLRVDEAEAMALLLEVYLALVVDDRVLARQVLDVVNLVRDEDL
jgi:predicted nucleic acid-binding protein